MNINPVSNQIPNLSSVQSQLKGAGKDPLEFQKILQNMINGKQSTEEATAALNKLPLDFAKQLTPKEIEQLAARLVSGDLLGDQVKKQQSLKDSLENLKNIPYMGEMKNNTGQDTFIGQVLPDDPDFDPETPQFVQQDDQDFTAKNVYQEGFEDRSTNLTPFQFFLDKSLEYFGRLSLLESQTDQLMVDYVEGRISLEELTIEKAKVSVGITFAVTVTSQVQQSFTSIINMNI